MGKKGLIGAIVVLSILVVGLGGFIVYDKVFATTDSNTNTTSEKETKNEKEQEPENETDSAEEVESDNTETVTDNTGSQPTTVPKCTGTYYGALSATETYKYTLNADGTFSAEFGGVSGTTGVYVINDNTISLIGKKDTVGPRNQDPYYNTEDYVMADDCSRIVVTKGSATISLDRQ